MKNFTSHTTQDGQFQYYTKNESIAPRLIPAYQGCYLYYTIAEVDDKKNHSDIKSTAFIKH
jgi:hypothetical protein